MIELAYLYLTHTKCSINAYHYLVVILLLDIENTGADRKLRGRKHEIIKGLKVVAY